MWELNHLGMQELLGDRAHTIGPRLQVMGERIANRASGKTGVKNTKTQAQYKAVLELDNPRRVGVTVYTANEAARAGEPVHRWLLEAFGAESAI
jgi:hypothetical protein